MLNSDDAINSTGEGAYFEDRLKLIAGGGTIGDANMSVNIMNGATIDAKLASGLTLTARRTGAGNIRTQQRRRLAIRKRRRPQHSHRHLQPRPAHRQQRRQDHRPGRRLRLRQNHDQRNRLSRIRCGSRQRRLFRRRGRRPSNSGFEFRFLRRSLRLVGGDSIDLRDFAYVPGSTGLDAAASQIGKLDAHLVLTDGATDSAALWLQGNYTSAYLYRASSRLPGSSDGSTGTLLKLASTDRGRKLGLNSKAEL